MSLLQQPTKLNCITLQILKFVCSTTVKIKLGMLCFYDCHRNGNNLVLMGHPWIRGRYSAADWQKWGKKHFRLKNSTSVPPSHQLQPVLLVCAATAAPQGTMQHRPGLRENLPTSEAVQPVQPCCSITSRQHVQRHLETKECPNWIKNSSMRQKTITFCFWKPGLKPWLQPWR